MIPAFGLRHDREMPGSLDLDVVDVVDGVDIIDIVPGRAGLDSQKRTIRRRRPRAMLSH
jgi:hypothetical protein